MEIVENLEEGVLRALLLGELVNVVDDEHVYRLIIPQEIHEIVVQADRVHKLGLETVGTDVEDYLVGVFLLDGDADGLGEMGLAETGASIYEEGIECSLAGFVGYAEAG